MKIGKNQDYPEDSESDWHCHLVIGRQDATIGGLGFSNKFWVVCQIMNKPPIELQMYGDHLLFAFTSVVDENYRYTQSPHGK